MSLFATLDIDICEDAAYLDLYDAHPGHPWRMIRLVSLAKRANQRGRILRTDGVPLDAKALARLHDGKGLELIELWESFLALCVELGLLDWMEEEACYKIRHWRRWHRSESDMPEARRERKRRSREGDVAPRYTPKPDQTHPRDSAPKKGLADSIPGTPPRDIALGHGCHDTEQSIAEHSRAEHHHRAQAREAVNDDDDFSKRNDVKRLKAAGVSQFEAHRFARACSPAVIEAALTRARGPGIRNPAAYLARELAAGGFAPPAVDHDKVLRERHDQVARRRRAARQSEAVAAERSSWATQAACDRFEQLPETEKRRILALHREQAERDSFCRVAGWGPGHPLWRGLLAEVMRREAIGA